ncbi:MAG: hypothetical protein HYV07_16405 [Deltaproteobacteria bacterium]|nr:hypothetical protein [Deltaproteobacteria bacterium]
MSTVNSCSPGTPVGVTFNAPSNPPIEAIASPVTAYWYGRAVPSNAGIEQLTRAGPFVMMNGTQGGRCALETSTSNACDVVRGEGPGQPSIKPTSTGNVPSSSAQRFTEPVW